ncbi:MAG: hypothetical protein HY787_13690 [Deltaproteobacteria bacterium]|nr:hypothetical protein [Deltaproteobacteria bacterium]
MNHPPVSVEPNLSSYEALAALYNALMTGVVLSLVTRRGEEVTADFVQAHFRRQHLEKFLPGLRKLGLEEHPHAVACALYHYHSNALGGVKTEYLRESDRKAWVRYPPPRWIWRGTAVCAVPHNVNIAMLKGWHAYNGVSLKNPRLGFVCTGTITSGAPGLEGYYYEYDRPITADERLRFTDHERMPRVDPAGQPQLDVVDWPEERRPKTFRSYAMEYVHSLIPTLIDLIGREAAVDEIGRTARFIGMQYYEEVVKTLGFPPNDGSPAVFARLLSLLLAAQGEDVLLDVQTPGRARVEIQGWRLMEGVALTREDQEASFRAWNELWIGAALAHNRFMDLRVSGDLQETMVWSAT